MPSLLFNPNTFFRILQFFCFWFLSWLSGKKNNPLITAAIILGIVFFNLLVPYGRVLFSAGMFKITAGALIAGIHRAVTLEGLVMLSRISIRQDLRIPGGFGELVGESFRLFAVIMNSRRRITRKNLIGDIDDLMTELSGDEPPAARGEAAASAGAETVERAGDEPAPKRKTSAAGYIILATVIILSWLPLIFMLALSLSTN
jgi:heptaprenyl diphosphate synthase